MKRVVCALILAMGHDNAPRHREALVGKPSLAAAEYQPSLRQGSLGAPNRAQGLRLIWSDDSLRVEHRVTAALIATLSTQSIGRPSSQQVLGPAPARQSPALATRVERDWRGLTEWFENSPDGVEHGWHVAQKPPGPGPLTLKIKVGSAKVELNDGAASLASASGHTLRYAKLEATDATSRTLPARLVADADGLSIEVDDSDAKYPLTIDPLLTSSSWSAESHQAEAHFGVSVASAGDVNGDGFSDVVVGAPEFDNGEPGEGRAFLYLGSATGLSPTATWTAESNLTDAFFGFSVASAGDVNGDGYADVVVGAKNFSNGETAEGRAFVYLGSAAGLSTTPAWTAEPDQANAQFGFSVASAGDVNGDGFSDVVVGANTFTNGEFNEGRALLYLGSAAGLSTTPAWTAESDQASTYFGTSVASAGDINGDGFSDVVVGANDFTNGETFEGRAFLYLGSAAGLATVSSWAAEPNQAFASFGTSVASAGDVNGDGFSDVLVGAVFFTNGQTSEGRVFLYLGSATGLSPTPASTVESNQANALFGFRVASGGDVNGDGFSDVVVGSPNFDNGESDEGRASLYLGSSTGLSTTAAWSGESNQVSGQFGSSVASAGDVNGDGFSDVVVGAPYFDNGEPNEGLAFLYQGNAIGLPTTPDWVAKPDLAGSNFGGSVASAGDVNGDGFSDAVVGAPRFTNGETLEGRAQLYLGTASGLSTTPAWAAESNQVNAEFGFRVTGAGDVNGDGFSDVVVAAHLFTNGELNEGRVFLYLGSATGLSTTPAWTAESNQVVARFGFSLASAGDVNGDGFSDVVVGAPNFSNGETREGTAFLYLGGATGLSTTPAWTAESNQANASFGYSVSGGDVNGDGFSDVVVGAYAFDNGENDEGRVFLYLGSATGLSPTPAWTAESDQVVASLGFSVANAGDVNGDGFSDVVVGAFAFDNGEGDEGRAFLYLGSSTGLSPTPAWAAESNQDNALFGFAVASAGDVNGDGFSDVVVGVPYFDNGEADEGRTSLYLGSATGLSTTPAWAAESNQANAAFGYSVASAGDINGDAFSDVIVGVPLFDNSGPNDGLAHVYLGGDGAVGLWRQLKQQFAGVPVGAGARVSGPGALSAIGVNSLAVQDRVALETELKRVGVPFNGVQTQVSPLSAAGLVLTNSLPPLTRGGYHWRARIVSRGERSRWVSFGSNSELEADFFYSPADDAGFTDAGFTDAGFTDAGFTDAGFSDAGFTDAGFTDAGFTDAGAVDADAGRPIARTYTVGCDCGSGGGIPAVFAVLLLLGITARRTFEGAKRAGRPRWR